ncbi:saccharopine dehydrogenase [Myceligenerans crystallogenes]|uniref:Saccharopine dehydrogenase n=1 Tax=Myceligenerans crystallogenes TaxID=316335 RepID=A0ABN2NGE9_9MICO
MPISTGLWLRREASSNEQRTVITPADAAALVADGFRVTVEESAHRVFPIDEYAAAGCRIVSADTWPDAPADEIVVGLKEPVPQPSALTHRHIFFGHAYKGQTGAHALLQRFEEGGGSLYDLECLTDENGRRLVAFGFWAGYAGAAVAVLHHRGQLSAPLTAMSRAELDDLLARYRDDACALVIGALGRSGRGAVEALTVAGVRTTGWDLAETRQFDKSALLAHDLLVNTIFAAEPGRPFLTHDDLGRDDRRLSVVSDVTCDVTSDCNRLPVNDKVTDWVMPARRLHDEPRLDVLAIDNLPSLLPRESSAAFSMGLLPLLRQLPDDGSVWTRSLDQFTAARKLTSER